MFKKIRGVESIRGTCTHAIHLNKTETELQWLSHGHHNLWTSFKMTKHIFGCHHFEKALLCPLFAPFWQDSNLPCVADRSQWRVLYNIIGIWLKIMQLFLQMWMTTHFPASRRRGQTGKAGPNYSFIHIILFILFGSLKAFKSHFKPVTDVQQPWLKSPWFFSCKAIIIL